MAVPQYMPWPTLLLTLVTSLFWGAVVTLRMTWGMIRKGPRKFFSARTWNQRPEALNDTELGTHHYARLKNIRLHYVAKGQEGHPLLLFIHGFPEMWYSWRYQLKEFGDNYRAVAVDMRGYGESDRPEGIAEYRVEKLTADIKELIEYLGYKKAHLVSHDWGGVVAWSFAFKYPAMVDKLVACNIPHPTVMKKRVQSSLSQFLKSWYMFMFQLPILPEIMMGSDNQAMLRSSLTSRQHGVKAANMSEDDLEAFLYTFRNYGDRTGPINYYRAAARYRQEALPTTKVKATTLIIWGTRDAFLGREMAEASKAYVDNTCYVAYIEGASHWVQQDEPELVNKYIRDFLNDDMKALPRK